MAWIELHQSLWTHKKTVIMAALLDIDELYAAAHMSKLWTWALDNASDGDLSSLPNRVIAFGAGWKGDADDFVDALIQSGWIDKCDHTTRLHDWYDYAGRLIEKKEANKERAKKSREQHAQRSRNVRAANDNVAGLPNLTIPNHTIHNSAAATAREDEIDQAIPEPPAADPEKPGTQSVNFYNEFHRIFRFYPSDTQVQIMDSYVKDGMEEEVVVRAIQRASENGQGFKFGLIKTILNDYMVGKVRTLSEAIAFDDAFEAARKNRGGTRQGSPPKSNNPFDKLAKELRSHDTG